MPPAPASPPRIKATRAEATRAEATRAEATRAEATRAEATHGETTHGETRRASAPRTPERAASWRALGTLVRLVVTDPRCLPEARALLEADLAAVTWPAAGSAPTPRSARAAGRAPRQQVSPLLAEAIAVALRAAELTGGDVDPTVGAALSALGYDRDFEQIQPAGPSRRGPTVADACRGWREVRPGRRACRTMLPPKASSSTSGPRPRPGPPTGPPRGSPDGRLRRAGQPGRRHRGRGPVPPRAAGGSGSRT